MSGRRNGSAGRCGLGWCPTRKVQLVSVQLSSINISVLVSGKRTEGNGHIRSGEKNSGKNWWGIRGKPEPRNLFHPAWPMVATVRHHPGPSQRTQGPNPTAADGESMCWTPLHRRNGLHPERVGPEDFQKFRWDCPSQKVRYHALSDLSRQPDEQDTHAKLAQGGSNATFSIISWRTAASGYDETNQSLQDGVSSVSS